MTKFSKWLSKAHGDDTKAYCKLCTSILTAKLSNLEKHRATAKLNLAEAGVIQLAETKNFAI